MKKIAIKQKAILGLLVAVVAIAGVSTALATNKPQNDSVQSIEASEPQTTVEPKPVNNTTFGKPTTTENSVNETPTVTTQEAPASEPVTEPAPQPVAEEPSQPAPTPTQPTTPPVESTPEEKALQESCTPYYIGTVRVTC